jgi:hypothetical protein
MDLVLLNVLRIRSVVYLNKNAWEKGVPLGRSRV